MRIFKFLSFTGPSGAGKTEVQNELVARATNLEIVISNTTRDARPSDKPGAYRHGDVQALAAEEAAGDVAWQKQFGSHWYWTRKSDLELAIRSKSLSTIILLPETVPTLMGLYPGRVLPIWVVPPKEGELRRRLVERGDSAETIERVLLESLDWVPDPTVPYQFLHNDRPIQRTVEDLVNILRANNFPIRLR